MKALEFAVKSKSFDTYKRFKKDAEKLGWKYAERFTPFNEKSSKEQSCLYFCNNFGHGTKGGFAFSFTNSKILDLDGNYSDVLKKLKNLKPIPTMVLNDQYTAFIDKDEEKVIVGCQTFTFKKIHQLAKLCK